MGVYRSLLEEEIEVAGVLDDNNNVDLKEIEDIVADQDANAAEQDRAQDAEFADPGTSVDDIMDESAMAIYEFENAHAKIMQAVGLYELSEAACGREFIFESTDDVKGFFRKIKDAIVKFFKKVWQVLQRWAGNLTAAFTSNKKLWDKYSTQIKNGYDSLKGTNNDQPEGYKFDANFDPIKYVKEFDKTDGEMLNKINLATKVTDVSDIEQFDFSADDLDASLKKIRGIFTNGASESGDGLAEAIKKAITGPKEKMWMTVEAVQAGLTDSKNYKKSVNELMKQARKQFNDSIKAIDELEKKASKLDVDKGRQKYMATCTRLSTYLRTCLSICQTARNATCSATNTYAHQARKYALIYIKAVNKEKYKGFQKESTEYGFLGKFL